MFPDTDDAVALYHHAGASNDPAFKNFFKE